MKLVIIGLDLTSIAILCYKCIVWKSARGLSWDMFVCIVIAAVLFVMPNLEFLFLDDISPSFIVMVICAFAMVVSFPFYAVKAPLEVPMDGPARPLFCRWYVLLFISLCIAVLLGDHHPDYSAHALPVTPDVLLPLYLDALSRIPQLWLMAFEEKHEALAYAFLTAAISTRVVECFTWVYFYSFANVLVLLPVLFQAIMGIDFLYICGRDMLRKFEAQRVNLISVNV